MQEFGGVFAIADKVRRFLMGYRPRRGGRPAEAGFFARRLSCATDIGFAAIPTGKFNRSEIVLHRRDALRCCAGGAIAALAGAAVSARKSDPMSRSGLGIVSYSCELRQRAQKRLDSSVDLFEPLAFLEHCHRLGAGGIQVPLGARDEAYTKKLRRRAEQYGMFIEGIVGAPTDRAGVERFDAETRTAAGAGVRAMRTVVIPGRRYETFRWAEEFGQAAQRARQSLERAAPVVAKHRVRLAVENHKDQLAAERIDLLKRIGSEWIGVCVDTGNNFALMEDPIEVVEAFAPWAFSVHLKDQAVREYEDGFLFADVPLGRGFLDLPRIVAILRKAKPDIAFCLEIITRDPLKIPCLTEKYWATFPQAPNRALALARTLRTVRKHQAAQLPHPGSLSPEDQLAQEDSNVKASLDYARKQLGL